jgi:hypothetical protein
MAGAKLARKQPGVWIDPAQYDPRATDHLDLIFGGDAWLARQRIAGVPVVLTDTPRIEKHDRLALRKALARWETIKEPTLVVLPLESWWLTEGRAWLTYEVLAAGRPVALVLLHPYNGLDASGAVAGLLEFVSSLGSLPVVLLRCDVSAIGAVAQGAFAGFIGWSAATRHGPLPRRQPVRDSDVDMSPAVFVPALHDYFKASRLPAFARSGRRDVLRCDEPACNGGGLLRIARDSEVNLAAARAHARRHNVASAEQVARYVLMAREPRDAWWEACKAGVDVTASLAGNGLMVPVARWLRQWLEMGSPAHVPETAA